MELKVATEVADEQIFNLFLEGYSDYAIKIEMDLESFVSRLLENENVRDHSYIAFEEDVAVGMILGNIQMYQGVKTMRCGGFAVIPSHRNKGIGKVLFKKHKEHAIECGCKSLYLEVLKVNKDAVRLYESLGYQSVYDYRFYKCSELNNVDQLDVEIIDIELETIFNLRETVPELHIHWQGEMFGLGKAVNNHHYCIKQDGDYLGTISINDNGRVNFIWVKEDVRMKGIGKSLLIYGLKNLDHGNLSAVASNNFLYEGFLRKLGFTVDIEQHEMMMPL